MSPAQQWDALAELTETRSMRAWRAGYIDVARALSHDARDYRQQANRAKADEAKHLRLVSNRDAA